jgi:hypothetical protein
MLFTIRSFLSTAFDALTFALSGGIINPFLLFFIAEQKHVINNRSLSLASYSSQCFLFLWGFHCADLLLGISLRT